MSRTPTNEHRATSRQSGHVVTNRRDRSISMHDGVAVWCDCCSCEAEPYWQAVAKELGIDLGSDYEPGAVCKARGRGPSDE